MKTKPIQKLLLAIIGCILVLAAPAVFSQVMSGSNPNPAYSGLQLWLEGNAGITSGGNGTPVTGWANQSTSPNAGGYATNSILGAGNEPTLDSSSAILNGQPALSFNGTSEGLDVLNAQSMLANANYTIFVVFQTTANTHNLIQSVWCNKYNDMLLYAAGPLNGTQYDNYVYMQGSGNIYTPVTDVTNNTPFLWSATQSGTGAGQTKMFINNVENDTGTAYTAATLNTNLNLGYQNGQPGRYFQGEIAEVLIYQGVLSAYDKYEVSVYLGTKYNIAIPSVPVTTPSYNPSSGTYANAQAVTVNSDAGATVYYTTNGTIPTTSSDSGTSPLVINVPVGVTNFTITAFATNAGFQASSISSNTYATISVPTPTWESPSSGSWTNSGNWLDGALANGSSQTADFSELTLSGNVDVTVDGTFTISNLLFGDQGNAYGWYLDYGASGPITMNAGASTPVVTVENQTVIIGASSAQSPLAGTNGFIKAGAGTLVFAGPAAFTGGTTVNAGLLIISNISSYYGSTTSAGGSITNNANVTLAGYGSGQYVKINSMHGSAPWTIDGNGAGGTYDAAVLTGDVPGAFSDATGDINLINYAKLICQMWTTTTAPIGGTENVDIAPNALLELVGTNGGFQNIGGLSDSGTVDFPDGSGGTNLTLIVGNNNQTANFSGTIENSGDYPFWSGGQLYLSVAKVGAGTQTLSSDNYYNGVTTVNDGILELDGALHSTSAVNVPGGTLDGTGTISAPVTVNAGGTISAGDGNIGTLNISGSLTLAGNVLAKVNEAMNPSNDYFNVSGALTYGGTLTATNIGGITPSLGDQFQIFPAGGSGNFTSILGWPGAGLGWSFDPATGILSVVGAPAVPALSVLSATQGANDILTFSWTGSSYTLQWTTNALNLGLWYNYPGGGVSGVTMTNNGIPAAFFRLVQ